MIFMRAVILVFVFLNISSFLILSCDAKKSRGGRGSWWWRIAFSQLPDEILNATSRSVNSYNQLDKLNSIPAAAGTKHYDIKLKHESLAGPFLHDNVRLFNKVQRRLLNTYRGSIFSVAKGANLAINECKKQFEARRWNCELPRSKIHGSILERAFRETSFINAITSAGLTYGIAIGCYQGMIKKCTCQFDSRVRRSVSQFNNNNDIINNKVYTGASRYAEAPTPDVQEQFISGGCTHNIKFGVNFANKFTAAAERGSKDLKSFINKHNNKAGTWHVNRLMQRKCKCHGTSGSCTTKTCWMTLPPFSLVGDALKERFDGSTKVQFGNAGYVPSNRRYSLMKRANGARILSSQFALQQQSVLTPMNKRHKEPGLPDLVYRDDSPDFCFANPRLGISGTQGRQCNKTSPGIDGCALLCCGRGEKEVKIVREEKCHCKFVWCCEVQCEKCTKTIKEYYCK